MVEAFVEQLPVQAQRALENAVQLFRLKIKMSHTSIRRCTLTPLGKREMEEAAWKPSKSCKLKRQGSQGKVTHHSCCEDTSEFENFYSK